MEDAVEVASIDRYAGRYRDLDAGQDAEVLVHDQGLAVRVPRVGMVELDGSDVLERKQTREASDRRPGSPWAL